MLLIRFPLQRMLAKLTPAAAYIPASRIQSRHCIAAWMHGSCRFEVLCAQRLRGTCLERQQGVPRKVRGTPLHFAGSPGEPPRHFADGHGGGCGACGRISDPTNRHGDSRNGCYT
mmetsp:Transcript_101712/g.283217  ORF Transcript_101712/g.283217 Transcript_101712/m.283217 type:complete len:115 (-) Transcript_101712:79-423(-)